MEAWHPGDDSQPGPTHFRNNIVTSKYGAAVCSGNIKHKLGLDCHAELVACAAQWRRLTGFGLR